MFKLIFFILGLALFAGVAFYFVPDDIKEKGLSYVSDSELLPASVKETIESIYATPSYKREKLLNELEANLGSLGDFITETSTNPEPAKKLLERTKEIVAEVIKQNTDPTIIKQITDTVTAKLLSSNSCQPK